MRCPDCSRRVPMADTTHHGNGTARWLCLKFVTFRKYEGCRGKSQYLFRTPTGEFIGHGMTAAEALAAPWETDPEKAGPDWGSVGPKCQALVERLLAAQGDAAEPDLVKLQHDLAELNSRDIPF